MSSEFLKTESTRPTPVTANGHSADPLAAAMPAPDPTLTEAAAAEPVEAPAETPAETSAEMSAELSAERSDETPTATGSAHSAGGPGKARHSFHTLRFVERYMLVGVWAVLIAFFAFTKSSSFLQVNTVQAIFGNSSIYVFLGLAALCTAAVSEIDLSVAFITGLCATIVPLLSAQHGVNVVVAAVIAVAVGALCGVINAVIIVTLRVDALIATLGFGTVLLGIAETIAHSEPVTGISTSFGNVATGHLFGLQLVFWYGIVLALIATYVMAYTPLGRNMAFVGSNREVARLAGIRVNRVRFGAYTAGGTLSGVAGVMLTAELQGFDPSTSGAYLLPTFAVVFLSASVVRPGRFNAIGVVIGAYFIATGTLGLELFGYSGPAQDMFYGGSLVGAVAAVTLVRRRSTGA